MGDFSTSKQKAQTTQNTSGTSTTSPWGPQDSYLRDIFDRAQDTYGKAQGQSYTGDHLAGFRPEQLDMFKGMTNYANTSPIATMLQGQGGNLSRVGQGAVGTGLSGLKDFRPTDTMGTITDAGLYADNPYMSSMVDAAMRDANRATYEEAIPGVQRNAALTGNTNSSRTGAREAVLQRANQDRAGDIGAQMRGAAYSQGIDAAQNERQMEMARLMGLTGTGLQTAVAGSNNLQDSVAAQTDLFGLGNAGGAGLQASDQQKLSNDLAKHQMQQEQIWGPLINYYNLIGGNKWGGEVTTKGNVAGTANTQNTASPAATFGGFLTGLGGLIPGN
jgi:hypothetical protein